MDNARIRAELKTRLGVKRLDHTMGVVETAARLARQYGADLAKTETAALLHDAAREVRGAQALEMCREYGLVPDGVEQAVPDLLHGKLAACLAKEQFGVDDEEILDAIRFHTTGRAGMTTLDKVIFVADMIEPGRDYPGVTELRAVADSNLDRAVVAGLESTIRYVLARGLLVHPASIEARNQLLGFTETAGTSKF